MIFVLMLKEIKIIWTLWKRKKGKERKKLNALFRNSCWFEISFEALEWWINVQHIHIKLDLQHTMKYLLP